MAYSVAKGQVSVRAHWNERWRAVPVPADATEETLHAVGNAAEALVIAARREKHEALADLRKAAIEELLEIAPDVTDHKRQLPSLFPDMRRD
jgi:hypothetical protein